MKGLPLLVVLACLAAQAQPPAVFKSETEMVLVDAVATNKKGEYVRDLTAKNFHIWEDGKQQTIRSFSLETGAGDQPNRLVLFFDDNGVSVADQVAARQAALRFVDANASPSQLIAVVAYADSFRVIQNFTGEAKRLEQALQSGGLTSAAPAVGRGAPVLVSDYHALLQSAETLVRNLSAAPGRKAVVLFTSSAAFSTLDNGEIEDLVQSSNRSNVALYPVLRGTAVPDVSDLDPTQPTWMGRRSQARVAPPTVSDDSQPYRLAQGTGGFVVPASADLLSQLVKIGEERSESYMLGYTPPPGSKPEACHSLRVKVERPGVSLRVRSGYCATKPQDLLAESRTEQELEKELASAPGSGPAAAHIEAPFFYVSPAVARVHAVMEVPTAAWKFENVKGKQHGEMNVLGVASSPDGAVAARFSDVVKRDFDTPQAVDAFKRGPLRYEKEFKIVPGRYNLTVVFSSGDASLGKIAAPLVIPARNAGQLAISGIAFGRELHPTADLGLESSLIDPSTPLIANGMQLIPAGLNVFAKTGPAYCYFEVYPPVSPASATLRVRVLNQAGQAEWDGGSAALAAPAGGKSAVPVGMALPVSQLAPGSYRLEVTVTDANDSTVQSAAAFELR
jgi:VWFA-related protein